MPDAGRYADRVVAGQPDPQGDGMPAGFAHRLVMAIGRPVLDVAFAGHFADRSASGCWCLGMRRARCTRGRGVTFNPEKVFLDDAALPDPDIGKSGSSMGLAM